MGDTRLILLGMRTLTTLLLCVVSALAQEAVVLVGGRYADSQDTFEVEVWSHSPNCGINIKNTPDSFVDRPGVAVLKNNLYVCGGRRIGTDSTSDDCDVYSLTDNVWTDGPTQPFNRTNNNGFEDQFKFRMATVGSTVVAAYQGNSYYPEFEPQEYQMSILGGEGWSEPTLLGVSKGDMFLGMVALDEKHVALRAYISYPAIETIYIVNVETLTVVTEISLDFHCYVPFLYNNQYTCVKEGAEELMGLSLSEDFSEPTWTVVQSLPADIFHTDYHAYFMTQLDGMLTGVFSQEAVIFYLEGEEWKSEEMEIPRVESGHVVIPCPMQ